MRLVESGPAGGAILSAGLARENALDEVLSFDMGGTTAKICFIGGGLPEQSRKFEVARVWRNLKGSGLPLRIPVTEMVEIGAGGGSIARLDELKRIQVGPASAGAEPGPACYGRGGAEPTVTDANVVLGRIDPVAFAGGTLKLDFQKAQRHNSRAHRRAARHGRALGGGGHRRDRRGEHGERRARARHRARQDPSSAAP